MTDAEITAWKAGRDAALAALEAHADALEAELTGNSAMRMSYGMSDAIICGVGYLREAAEILRGAGLETPE